MAHHREEQAKLAAAAPALVRALLKVEWPGMDAQCGDCLQSFPRGHKSHHDAAGVLHVCSVDAALTAAGLPDQASRDEARAPIARRGK